MKTLLLRVVDTNVNVDESVESEIGVNEILKAIVLILRVILKKTYFPAMDARLNNFSFSFGGHVQVIATIIQMTSLFEIH